MRPERSRHRGHLLALVGLALAGCHDHAARRTIGDAGPVQRVFEPPVGKVRAVPPHDIHPGGVGPYALGAPLRDVLGMLPHGPRIELLQLEGVVDFNLVRTDGDGLLIGASHQAGVGFVAVLAHEIARTDGGLAVGSTRAELERALGPALESPDRLGDPRVLRFAGLAGARFVMEGDRTTAIIVTAAADAAQAEAGSHPVARPAACTRGPHDDDDGWRAAVTDGADARLAYGCFTGEAHEVLLVAGESLTLVGGDPRRPRRLWQTQVQGLLFAGGLDVDGDGRDEVVVVSQRRKDDVVTIRVDAWDLDLGRTTPRASDEMVYRLSAGALAWVGAKLADLDLLVEVTAVDGELDVGGLYLHRVGRRIRELAPLEPHTIAVARPRRRGPGELGASAIDAGPAAAAPDAGPAAARRP